MFTGIVRAMGTLKSIRRHGTGRILVVDLGALGDGVGVGVGDSIAVNGACLTVAEIQDFEATFAASKETLARCLIGEWRAGARLNLEPALTLQTPLGGHLVSGHIDGVGTLTARHDDGDFTRLDLEAPLELGRLIARKGAIAVDGVSLTVNAVSDDISKPQGGRTNFTVMVVPHTLKHTTLGDAQPGARHHLEADMLARYVQRIVETGAPGGGD